MNTEALTGCRSTKPLLALAAVALLAACSGPGPSPEIAPACPTDFSGMYRVISATTDPNGCGPGDPVTGSTTDYLSIHPRGDGLQEISHCRDADAGSCGRLERGLPALDMPGEGGSCIGIGRLDVEFDRDNQPRCLHYIYRLTVSGTDPITLVGETYEFSETPDGGTCSDDPAWNRGENLPECTSATHLTAERI